MRGFTQHVELLSGICNAPLVLENHYLSATLKEMQECTRMPDRRASESAASPLLPDGAPAGLLQTPQKLNSTDVVIPVDQASDTGPMNAKQSSQPNAGNPVVESQDEAKTWEFDLRTALNMTAAAWQGYLMPTEGGKFVNSRANGTTTQYFSQEYVVENFASVLKVAVRRVDRAGELLGKVELSLPA